MATLEILLQDAGFTDYEARAYVALLHKNGQTGYELAKTSRIPRANVYEVLSKLEARGAATRIVSSDTLRYAAVDPEIVLRRMKTSFSEMVRNMELHFAAISRASEQGVVESFEGYENLISFIDDLVLRTSRELLIAVHPAEALRLKTSIHSVHHQGIDVRTLCLQGCKEPCGTCCGEFHKAMSHDSAESRWLVVVSDGQAAVAGEIHHERVCGFRTRLPILTKMMQLYMEQSMLIDTLVTNGKLCTSDVQMPSESLI